MYHQFQLERVCVRVSLMRNNVECLFKVHVYNVCLTSAVEDFGKVVDSHVGLVESLKIDLCENQCCWLLRTLCCLRWVVVFEWIMCSSM